MGGDFHAAHLEGQLAVVEIRFAMVRARPGAVFGLTAVGSYRADVRRGRAEVRVGLSRAERNATASRWRRRKRSLMVTETTGRRAE